MARHGKGVLKKVSFFAILAFLLQRVAFAGSDSNPIFEQTTENYQTTKSPDTNSKPRGCDAVCADSIDKWSVFQTTGFRVDYLQWKEYLQTLVYADPILTEKGPLYHLFLNWRIHYKARLSLAINVDAFWGNQDYLSHVYNSGYDTTLTESSSSQYAGVNAGIALGYDFNTIPVGGIPASFTPMIGVKYLGWKHSVPWESIYQGYSYYGTYFGYDEYWINLLATAGAKFSLKVARNVKLSIEAIAGVPGYVLERVDYSNAAGDRYQFDLKPKLNEYVDGKAQIFIGSFSIGITANALFYQSSPQVHVTRPVDDYRFQPKSVAKFYGLSLGYTLPVARSRETSRRSDERP